MHEAPLTLRTMAATDLPGVLEVERESFARAWPPTAFDREIVQNKLARYFVLMSGGRYVGFAGLWLVVDQAHVVTVAVSPAARRKGYGRLLVHALILLARAEGMAAATLEVRASNAAARALYAEYGFVEVGVRKGYYSDNKEDAVIMTTEEFGSDAFKARMEWLAGRLEARVPGAAAALASVTSA